MRKIIFILICVLLFPARVHAQSFNTARLYKGSGRTRFSPAIYRQTGDYFRRKAVYVETIETDMLALLNKIRADYNVPPLTQNWELTRIAKYKSEEMKNLDYAAHDSPLYGNPADMLDLYKIPFNIVGENVAAGQAGINGVLYEWFNTPVYRRNILFDGYREAGVGFSRNKANGNSYWVLLLIS